MVGRRPTRPTSCDVRDVLDRRRRARRRRRASIDEIGFHHATSVAELLADRGCAVEVVTPGMVVGQDLGITLDMESWWMRADGQGHRADRPTSCRWASTGTTLHAAAPPDRRRCQTARPDWVVLAVPASPVEWLYHDLQGGRRRRVERVGDCVAPRRAHAAVVEGERARDVPVQASPRTLRR